MVSWKLPPKKMRMCLKYSKSCSLRPRWNTTWVQLCGDDADRVFLLSPVRQIHRPVIHLPLLYPITWSHLPYSCSIYSRSATDMAREIPVLSRKISDGPVDTGITRDVKCDFLVSVCRESPIYNVAISHKSVGWSYP